MNCASLLFLDTSYVIGLKSPGDWHHPAALQWERRIRADSLQVVTAPRTALGASHEALSIDIVGGSGFSATTW